MGFECGEGETVDGVDFSVADVLLPDTFFEFVADFGIEGHKSTASGWEGVVDGDEHLDDGEGLAGASDRFKDEVARGLVGPLDGSELLVSHGG